MCKCFGVKKQKKGKASGFPRASVVVSHVKRCPFPQQASAFPTASVGVSHSKRRRFPQQASAFPTASVGCAFDFPWVQAR